MFLLAPHRIKKCSHCSSAVSRFIFLQFNPIVVLNVSYSIDAFRYSNCFIRISRRLQNPLFSAILSENWGINHSWKSLPRWFFVLFQSDCRVGRIIFSRCVSIFELLNSDLKKAPKCTIFSHFRPFCPKIEGSILLQRDYLNEFLSFFQSDCCVERIIFSRCVSIFELFHLDPKKAHLARPPVPPVWRSWRW